MTPPRSAFTTTPRLRRPRPRSAFTLLELLIAAALSSVLLAVVWHTLATHSRLYEKRGEATDRSQLARAVRYQFLSDIDHLIRSPSTSLSDTSLSDTSLSDTSLSDTPSHPLPYGLRGDHQSLELAVLVPQWHPPTPGVSSDPQDPTHLPENAQAPSPVRLIRYRFVGSPRAENALPGSLSQVVVDAIAQETAPLSESNLTNDSGSVGRESDDPALPDRQPQGFLREVYARPDQALMAPSQKRDPTAEFPHALQRLSPSREEFRAAAANSASPHVTVDHVPEIDRLEFRYFDGQRWHTSWDSSISGALPVAVEMTFELALPQQPVRPTRPARQSDRVAGTTLPANTRQHIPPSGSVNLAEASHALNGAAFRSLAVLRAPLRTPPSPVDMEVTR